MTLSIDNATPEEWSSAANAAKTAMKEISALNLEVLNTLLDKPFGEAKLVDRCLAFALWQEGYPIEHSTGGAYWNRTPTPQWSPKSRYRVLPKPEELVLPSIDWSHVAPQWKWLAQDEGGVVMLFDHRPMLTEPVGLWGFAAVGGKFLRADHFASAKPGKGDWRKLIVQRPEGM